MKPREVRLVSVRDGLDVEWVGSNTPVRPGAYRIEIGIPAEPGSDVLTRYTAGEVEVQEGETAGPIRVSLHEIR